LIEVVPYRAAEHRELWDGFVREAKNGVFLFERGYMDYHSDRFEDASLLFFRDGRLAALMPASRDGDRVVSHGGLTFGGVVSGARMSTPAMVELFQELVEHLREAGVTALVYKAVPHFYHRVPAEEDLYALFLQGARLVRRDVSSLVAMARRPRPAKGRRWAAKAVRARGVEVERSRDFAGFMAIEEALLGAKYGRRPVHTAAEMELLAGRFPENIHLFTAVSGEELLAGVIVYESEVVAHAQYIGATGEGKRLSALDAVLGFLLDEVYAGKPYFDFGISTERDGRVLNAGLIANKESYGARAAVYDFYELSLSERAS
jgi:hypothetical protein